MAKRFFAKNRKFFSWLLVGGLAVVILFSESYWEQKGIIGSVVFVTGLILVSIAIVGRLWCSLYISGYKTDTLITTGPYSACRNPLYFFSFLGGLGLGLASEMLTVALVILVGFALYYPFLIRAEEKKLHKRHKNNFEDYMNSVPRFFPSLRKLKESEEYIVKPIAFRKGLFDALWFIWMVGILELIEALHECKVLPILLRLY